MRKIRITITVLCFIMLLSVTTAFGAIASAPDIQPMAANYMAASASISLSKSTVKVTGTITGKLGQTTKTSINLYLQQYRNGSWVTIDNWTSSGNTESRSLSKSKTVTKGYKYRAKAVCTAYVGSDKETVTKYSKSISY
ncbi:MAG: hypothetical protein ACI4LY_05230 [Candidatus Fimisoma sp.]